MEGGRIHVTAVDCLVALEALWRIFPIVVLVDVIIHADFAVPCISAFDALPRLVQELLADLAREFGLDLCVHSSNLAEEVLNLRLRSRQLCVNERMVFPVLVGDFFCWCLFKNHFKMM